MVLIMRFTAHRVGEPKGDASAVIVQESAYVVTSLLLAQCGLKRVSPLSFSGTCTAALFNRRLEQSLIPVLRPGQTVVMDNAAIHKSKETEQLIGRAGCGLLFLPPYSPDFNPIEKTFGMLKKRRQFMPKDTTLDDLVCSIL